jgi:hypothetical protein
MTRTFQAIVIFATVAGINITTHASVRTTEQIQKDWLKQQQLRNIVPGHSGKILPHQDAAGACDGIKNGVFGFHTDLQEKPWWQIDLGSSIPLEKVVIYNRTVFANRAANLIVLISDDDISFKLAYKHNGNVFYGHKDNKPLTVLLNSASARYIRIQLTGKNYLHLDEVEIYKPHNPKNIALQLPATQSSISNFSAWHIRSEHQKINRITNSGLKLAQCLTELGINVDTQTQKLMRIAEQNRIKQYTTSPKNLDDIHLQTRMTIRNMALKNPLLDFDSILFVKRVPPAFPHMSDQYYGWWSRPGGGIYILENFMSDSPNLKCLTKDWPQGSFLRPNLSYDAKKVLFAYCKFYSHVYDIKDKVNKANLPEDAFYKIYEMNIDGSGVRRLTNGKYDDFDARYLPSGDVIFLSTRKGQAITVCNTVSKTSTISDLPDSYVRCGGGNWRPVPVFTLHRIDRENNIRPISAFENFEWTPTVADDGRILYTRWDYIDRFNGATISLWSTNTNGTNSQLVYGNFTKRPQAVFEARSIPNSTKIILTAGSHHSNMGGSLVLFDRNKGDEFERPLKRLTPEVCFPETEGWPNHYYANPFPLSEDFYLVAWSDKGLPGHSFIEEDEKNPRNPLGIYLYDAFGNLELLYRDPNIASMYPIPIRPRIKPPTQPDNLEHKDNKQGTMLVQDIYQGMRSIKTGSIKRIRIIGVPPKTQPKMNKPNLGVSKEDPGKFILGTVPVETDGSAHFKVPAGVPVFFQALDKNGIAVQTMRSLTYLQPGQTLSCIGCHESRDTTPPPGNRPIAALRPPSKITPGPEGSWPLRFDIMVQPVLDKLCTSCHYPTSDNKLAAKFDLTDTNSYNNMLAFADNDLKELAYEKDRSLVGQGPAANSKLLQLLTDGKGHQKVKLDPDSYNRLVTWMDVYAQKQGHFSNQQEQQLIAFRKQLAPILTTD